ncbi:hypothetical protein [Dokdonella sp.]|uniref:hypothetical protein n=1 Tax=Dokdonella sp. TaxID=2291710 RepID=UPI002F42CD34
MTDPSDAAAAAMQTPFDLWSAWYVNATGMQAEWLRFATSVWLKDARAVARLATCATPIELASAQAALAQEALADWFELQRKVFGEFDPDIAGSALAVA